MARKAKQDPSKVRTTKPVDPDLVRLIHRRLSEIEISVPKSPTPQSMRGFFSLIRDKRNQVSKVISSLYPKIGIRRGELVRIEGFIDSFGSYMTDTGDGLLGVKNDRQRQARIKVSLDDWFEAKTEVKADLAILEEVMSHAKMVRDEIRSAFDEGSRLLSSMDLEWKIEKDA